MIEKKLNSGRKVLIKEMSVDQIDQCTDIPEVIFAEGSVKTIKNSSKARTQWIRYGLGGGDFKDYKEQNGVVADNTIKEMTLEEKDDLSDKEVKELARAHGIKGVKNKQISELREEPDENLRNQFKN